MPNTPFRQIRVMGKNDKTYDAIINIDNIVHILPDGLTCILSMTDGSTLRTGLIPIELMNILDQGWSSGRRESIRKQFKAIIFNKLTTRTPLNPGQSLEETQAEDLAYLLVEAI